ncbi:hypothetical protein V8F33_010056 [Rhypophila sp. PSN 637]
MSQSSIYHHQPSFSQTPAKCPSSSRTKRPSLSTSPNSSPSMVTIDDSEADDLTEEDNFADAPEPSALAQVAAWNSINVANKYDDVLNRNHWANRELGFKLPNLPRTSAITVGRYALQNAAESCDEVMDLYQQMGDMMDRAKTEFAQRMDELETFRLRLRDARGETVTRMEDKMWTVMNWEEEVKRDREDDEEGQEEEIKAEVKRTREDDEDDDEEEVPVAKKPRYHELMDEFASEGRKEGRYELNPILTRLNPRFEGGRCWGWLVYACRSGF